MAPPEGGRARAVRVPLDYFKSHNRWERGKAIATVVVVAVAGAWWGGGVLFGRQEAKFHSPGRLAAVHQTWENQCSACHADFHPIRDDTLGTYWQSGAGPAGHKCQTCHQGPPHFAKQAAAQSPGCASCHQDHRGMEASLLCMDDRQCTQCHDSVHKSAIATGAAAPPVSRFDAVNHPEFASAKKDPGRLKFSHYIHLIPGFMKDPGQAWSKTPWTYARIADKRQRGRYMAVAGTKDENAVIQLQCQSCHQLDSGDFRLDRVSGLPLAILPARSAGSRMLPIMYENQCQACHTLDRPGLPATVQHRQSAAQVQEALRLGATYEYFRGRPELKAALLGPAPLPNQRPPLDRKVIEAIDDRVEIAERRLSQDVCGKCHYFQPSELQDLRQVIPPQLPQVWFEKARFDHYAHRAMDCLLCHEQASRDRSRESDDRKTAYMPDRSTCLLCHAPPSVEHGEARGGARFDCAECHRYHNGQNRMAGVGAEVECPIRKLSVGEFHNGEAKTGNNQP